MKLIILDQTGVINQSSDAFIKTPDEWIPIPGSLDAIARLTHSGYRVVIATNQSGIGRGLLDMATYNAINDKMYKAVNQAGGRIDAIFFCPHTSADKCSCRKPATGLLDEIMQRYGVNLKNAPAVGDSLKDLQAAAAVGARLGPVRDAVGGNFTFSTVYVAANHHYATVCLADTGLLPTIAA